MSNFSSAFKNMDAKIELKRYSCAVIAAVLFAVNIKTFVKAGGLYPGGFNGLTLLIQGIFQEFAGMEIPYTMINVILNAIPVFIGLKFIGVKFTMSSCVVIVLSSILTDLIPSQPITYDPLLISIFGGLINGFAISLCLKCDATTGGTDFISIFLSRRKGIDAFNIILGFNVVILAIAGLLFGWDKALYSMIFQYTSTQVLHLLYKQYQKQTLFIVTNKAEAISQLIYDTTVHGATIIDCEGAHKHSEHKIVYSVVSRDENNSVIRAVREADPQAFINSMPTNELEGHFYQRPID